MADADRVLEGRAVLITGAGRGIGKAVAVEAARAGAAVALGGLHLENLKQTLAEVRGAGGDGIAVEVDVANSSAVEDFVGAAVARFGRLHGAVNNAGLSSAGAGASGHRLGEVPEEALGRLIDVNLMGTWRSMRAELSHMLSAGGGSIVNMSSIAGLTGVPNAGSYASTKHAIIGLSKTAAVEYARDGIRVNAVCPGLIDTDFLPQSSRTTSGGRIPMGRYGEASEIATLTVWLLSDRASYVTGASMVADGGMLAW